MSLCPCGLEQDYSACCGLFIEGGQFPSTPEQLMRSRYTAFTQANIDYIARTMKSPAADRFDLENTRGFAQRAEWKKLEVLNTSSTDTQGFVEFFAHFLMNGKRQVIHEKSEFHLIDGIWYYVDGIDPKHNVPIKAARVARNEPCLCGSEKKYKHCCGQPR